jgi:hypothetical protein
MDFLGVSLTEEMILRFQSILWEYFSICEDNQAKGKG